MSAVIVGGNERMIRRYEEMCREYSLSAKVYIEAERGIQNFGCPDLLVLFTGTMSHKMLQMVTKQAKKRNIRTVYSRTVSMAALKGILEEHVKGSVQGV